MKTTTIRIKKETKDKFDDLQEKLSYKFKEDLLFDMINFFIKNNINPQDKAFKNLESFSEDLKKMMQKDSTRIIKILNKYERDYLIPTFLKVENKFKEEIIEDILLNSDKEVIEPVEETINKLNQEITLLKSKLLKSEQEYFELLNKRDLLVVLSSDIINYFTVTTSVMSSNKRVVSSLKDPKVLERIIKELERLK